MRMARAAGSLDHVMVMLRRGRLVEAQFVLKKIVAAEPGHLAARDLLASTYSRMGDEAFGQGEFTEAVAAFEACLRLAPGAFQVLYNKGVSLYQAGQAVAAAECYKKAIALESRFAPAHSALGVLQAEAGEHSLAIESHQRALALDAGNAEFHNNLGLALDSAQRLLEAVASFDSALALAPAYATAWLNRGVSLHRLWRLAEALASVDHALALDAHNAEAWSNRGLVLNDLGRADEALAADERATTLHPELANAWANRAATCNQLKRYEEATVAFERALAIDPNMLEARGDLLHTRMLLCDWTGFDDVLTRIETDLSRDNGTVQPFVLLPTPIQPELLRLASERLAEREPPARSSQCIPYIGHARIRLGYFSADFRQHAMMFLMGDVFELHDRERFETIGFSIGPPSTDPMRRRAEAAFERFIDVVGMSDDEVAALARSFELDIAVDLGGFTRYSRPGIFARRAAPVQVNYLGYPGTLGASYIDYLIADAVVIPERLRRHYTEKIACMPHCYMGNAAWHPLEPSGIDRQAAGLPEGAFVFCCFNNNYKITPDVFRVWMRLLQRVPGSVLWLLEGHAATRVNLCREAEARGVGAERLVFAGRVPRAEHLRRHVLADLFLDTLHYGAHTTASDALRTGLPVVTRIGETFASRVAASLVAAIGMPELVVSDLGAYEALAFALANDPVRLAALRQRILANAPYSPVFDAPRFARDMEVLYVAMHERNNAGLAPEHLPVRPS